jgi:hypothetical protein
MLSCITGPSRYPSALPAGLPDYRLVAARNFSARRRASFSISGQGHAGWAAKTRSIQSAMSFRSSGTVRSTLGSNVADPTFLSLGSDATYGS